MKNAFGFKHLEATAPELARVSERFSDLARWLVTAMLPSAERTAALRKLLEAKDCAVRAFGDIGLPSGAEDF